MVLDSVLAEVRAIREAYAAKFNYDLAAIYRDLKEQERKSGRTLVNFAPRLPAPTQTHEELIEKPVLT